MKIEEKVLLEPDSPGNNQAGSQ